MPLVLSNNWTLVFHKKGLDIESRAKSEPRSISVFRLKCPALAMGNTADTCIMKGSIFTQERAFFYKQCFHNEIHAFFQSAYSFHDLSLRHAYLSINCTPCFGNHYTALVFDTLDSACVATARLTAILDRHVDSRRTTTRVASTMESANPVIKIGIITQSVI